MKTNFESRKRGNQGDNTTNYLGGGIIYITQALTAGITNAVTLALTVVISILVILGGLILAYYYLPTTVFNIILVVLVADILIGISARIVHNRRTR